MFSDSTSRSSFLEVKEVFCKESPPKNFAILTRKYLCWSLFFNFIKRLQHRCFPVNIAKFLRTAFYRTPLLAPAKISLLNPKKKLFNKSLVMKTFKCPLPIDFAFIIPISTQNIQHSWRQHFLARTSLLS